MTDNKKAKRLTKEEVNTKLLDSITINEILESEDLNQEAEEVQDLKRAAEIINGMNILLK